LLIPKPVNEDCGSPDVEALSGSRHGDSESHIGRRRSLSSSGKQQLTLTSPTSRHDRFRFGARSDFGISVGEIEFPERRSPATKTGNQREI
jgi:hypothetical protein